jgi:hypothetical protein
MMKIKLSDGKELVLPASKAAQVQYLADIFTNRGQLPDSEERIDWQTFATSILRNRDAVAVSEIRPLLQSTLEVIIREPVEPMMVITGLFNLVQARGLETKVLSGAMGAVQAGDVQEHGTYPEVMFQVGGGLQTAWIGKSGIAASFTDEALRYSTWDIMAMNLRLMRQALVRHKEQKAVSFLKTLGTELYNNATPATSLFGVCTGRGLDMAANGSMTMDDLFRGMAHMQEEGFSPDVMLMNPLFFYMFIQDPVLRSMMLAHGGGEWFRQPTGQSGPLDPWSNGSMGAQGPSLGNRIVPGPGISGQPETGRVATGVAGREHGMTAAPPMPAPYFPWSFRVMVSPLVPFDPDAGLGDIFLLSSGNVGYHLVDEDVQQVEWRDEAVETVKVKLRERYGFAIAHEGQGVGVYKNVKLARNYWDGVVHAQTMDVESEISPSEDLSAIL